MTWTGQAESLLSGVHLTFLVNFNYPSNASVTFIGRKGQKSTFQARIPHQSFSTGNMVRWYGKVSSLGQLALVGLDGSLAHCFHPLLLNQVQDKSGSIHVAPPQRNRKNDDEGDESGSVDITTEMLYCGTVIGPPAGSDSPMVPVLEWSVNRFV